MVYYSINYHLDGGELLDSLHKFTASDLPYIIPIPIKAGFKFLGWYLDDSFTTKNELLIEAKDYALYAQFKEIKVPDENKIIYHLNGGTWGFNSKEELATSFLSDYYNFLMTTDQKPTVD